MKNYILILGLTLSGFLLTNCSKTVEERWVIYEEEGCLPPWVSLKNDNRTRDNLEDLLRNDGIIPLRIKISGERNDNCNDCNCLTGKIYRVQVDKSQLNHMYYFGFRSE